MPVKINDQTIRQALWGRDSYGLLLILLLVDYVMMSLVNSPRWGGLLRTAPLILTALFAMHTSDARRHVLRVTQVVAGASLVVGIVQAAIPATVTLGDASDTARGVSYLAMALLLLVTMVAILRRIIQKDSVDLETVFGAVSAYIVIGLMFSALFTGLAYVHTAPPFLAQPPTAPHQPSDYVYLSFITLTTVGFGDLTPLTDMARSVVVLEALIGQIFLVTLVARLVSLYSRDSGPTRYFSREPRAGHTRRSATPDDLMPDPDAPGSADPDG